MKQEIGKRVLDGAEMIASQLSSRRQWLSKVGRVGLAAGGITLAGIALKKLVLHTSPRPAIPAPEGQDIYPGWIGASQTVFFDSQGGPEKFITTAIMTNPILKDITSRLLKDFSEAYTKETRYSLDQIYKVGLKHAEEVFSKIEPSKFNPNVNKKVEELLAGSVAIAFACSGWATKAHYQELKAFQKMIPEGVDAQTFYWFGEKSVARTIFPKIMPNPEPEKADQPEDEPSNGEDGTRHFTMLAALYQLIHSSVEQKTGLEDSSPNILKNTAKFLLHKKGFKSTTYKAAFYTELAGLFYELKSTFKLDHLPLPGKDLSKIKSGLFDPGSYRDLLVNAKAVRFGSMIRFSTEMTMTIPLARERLIKELEDPQLSYFPNRTIMDGFFQSAA